MCPAMKLFDLSDDVAVVIGATGALGGAIAEGLASAGAKVAVVGRNLERGTARVQAIKSAGGQAQFFNADAVARSSLKEAHGKIEAALGAPTILVNAAGGNDPKVTVTPDNAFENIPLEAWHANFDLNLVGGVFLPCQEFGPAMCQRGRGSIINIASVSAHLPLSRVVTYSAAKAAVLSLSLFLAGCVGCAVAWNIWSLIAFRALAGTGAAVFPLSFAIIRDEFPPEKVGVAIGLVSSVFGVGGGFGIVLSGLIVDHLSWRWLFIFGSIGIALAIVLVARFVPESPIKTPSRVDFPGAALLSPFSKRSWLDRHRGIWVSFDGADRARVVAAVREHIPAAAQP